MCSRQLNNPAYIQLTSLYQLQYSSQVTSPAGTRKCHNGTPREASMLTCPAQDLRVTAWIIASHAIIFSRQQIHCEDQPAPRPAEHSSLHSILASHLRTIFIKLQRQLLSYLPTVSGCYSEFCVNLSMDRLSPHWSDSVVYCLIFFPAISEHD